MDPLQSCFCFYGSVSLFVYFYYFYCFLQLQICPLPLPIITLQCLFVYFQPGHTTTKKLSHKSSEIARSSKIWKKTSPFQLRFWSRHCVTWLWSGQGILCQNILQRIKNGLRCFFVSCNCILCVLSFLQQCSMFCVLQCSPCHPLGLV